MKDIKIFLKKEKRKGKKKVQERYQNLSEKHKEKLLEYMRNYYLAYKKITVYSLEKILLILG